MKDIKRVILSLFCILFCTAMVWAQEQKVVSGMIKDEKGEPLVGATVVIKGQPGLGTAADINGQFKLKVGAYDILEVSFTGYERKEVPVATIQGEVNIVLKEITSKLDEVVVTATGRQRKITTTGAVTTIDVKQLKSTPTANVSNALLGVVPGIIGRQVSGEPGENNTEFWVRGISTFGANDKALILVDGIERNLDEVNVEDIESFTVLKDASATAIYGQRGANGVVLINTKRGAEGKVNINFKAEYSYNQRTITPKYVGGITYANMANEARLSRYQDPVYTQQDISIINNGLDPDLFPNIDWGDVVLKDGASKYRATLSASGGGATAKYYISGAYYREGGMYITSSKNKYETNSNYERYNYRSNVDVNLTKTTQIHLGVGGWLVNQSKPGTNSDDIWASLTQLTPVMVPRLYSNGQIPAYDGDHMNPETLLTQTGYETIWESKVETNISLEQDLAFVTSGLKVIGTFSFDTYSKSDVKRTKNPEVYRAERLRDAYGQLVTKRVKDATVMSMEPVSQGDRRYYAELKLDYQRTFGQDHRIAALMMYYQQEKMKTNGIDKEVIQSGIPERNMALSGRFSYGYKDRYLAEFNFGYTGSENFPKKHRFGFFPAISTGWVISEESFIKDNIGWLDMFKVRYSYGEVGNDKMSSNEADRFPFMTTIDGMPNEDSYVWGEFGMNLIGGYRIKKMGASNLTWEVAQKHDLGLDISLFNNKLTATIDWFKDKRKDIFMQRSQMPYSTGLQDVKPWANVGKMESHGWDGNATWSDQIGELQFTLRGNFTYAKTEVTDHDEAVNALPYQMQKGYRLNQTRGWVALGLFKDDFDIATSPKQMFGGEEVLPGDIKYKDVNGDGIINDDDKVPMGYTTVPNLVYGAGLSMNWKGFDFNILFQGSGKTDFFVGGHSVYPFQGSDHGNILEKVSNPKDRWISREISGDISTENPNAKLPRLTYGDNKNNYRESSYWLKNKKYLRLKNVEFGYTLPKTVSRKIMAESMRVGFIGYNLAVFSPFKWWDPELDSTDGAKYPVTKTYSFNLTINF